MMRLFEGLDLHINALKKWNENLTEILNINESDYIPDDQRIKKPSKEVESNKSKCLAMFLVANVSFINSVVDSNIFKALCISFFDKNYHLPYEPIFIFTYLIETFRLDLDYSDPFSTPVKRGEYLFRLLRAFRRLKSTYDVITMIFVCVSRYYGICSRIVSKYPPDLVIGIAKYSHLYLDSTNQQRVWCEFFDTKDRLWKYVDFATPIFDKETYKYNESSSYLASLSKEEEDGTDYISLSSTKVEKEDETHINFDDRDIAVEMEFKMIYKKYLYIHRNNKLFIYTNSDKPNVVCIIVFPKYTYRLSRMLFLKEYPFETYKKIEKLKSSFTEKTHSTQKQRKTLKNTNKNIFILSCNIGGIVSEVTSKYAQKDLSYKRTITFIKWFSDLLSNLNKRRISFHINDSNNAQNKDLERLSIDILNANLLESVDNKFINNLITSFPIPTKKTHFVNHPLYVLKSQIRRNFILKDNCVPIDTFGDDLVYLKSDLEEVKTRFGWYKENLQIKPDSKPIQLYSASHNKKLEYYTKDQTEPLKQDHIDELDRFTINLSGKRYIPENSVYIKGRKYLDLEKICQKNKIFFKRAYSSLHYEDGSLKPKVDGIVIKSEELDRFLKLYDAHIEFTLHDQLEKESLKFCMFWKKVFIKLLNNPPVNKSESSTSVKKKVAKHTNKFLNQLLQ